METMEQPTLTSERLILRPFDAGDAAAVQTLAGDREIADTTLRIPHPYEDGMADEWIAAHRGQFEAGTMAVFAIELKSDGELAGAISLTIERGLLKAEMGYWVGTPFWNKGYCTEAARRIVEYGFEDLGLNRIAAQHFVRNPSSGRVMQKIGMRHEGTLKEAAMKWDRFEDLELYSLLRREWLATRV